MAALSNYLENKLVDFLFRDQAYTPPAAFYIALYTAAPSDAGGGTEVSGGSYARVEVTCSLTAWMPTQGTESPLGVSDGTGGVTSNVAAITFPTPSAGWGEVTHWAIHDTDGSPAGNLLFWAALTTPKTINSGDSVAFAAGSLTVTFA